MGTGKKAPRSSTRVPWAEAVALLGGEPELVALIAERKGTATLTPATRSHYRHQGIPIQEIGPEILAAWRAALERSLPYAPGTEESSARGEVDPMPDVLKAAQDELAAIYFHYKPDSKEWRAVVGPIHELRPAGEPGADAHPQVSGRRAS